MFAKKKLVWQTNYPFKVVVVVSLHYLLYKKLVYINPHTSVCSFVGASELPCQAERS